MTTTHVVWLRVVDDAREVRLRVGKRYAGQEVQLRVPKHLQLTRKVPSSSSRHYAHAFVTPEFEVLSNNCLTSVDKTGELIVHAKMVDEFADAELVILSGDGSIISTVSFRGSEDLQIVLIQRSNATGPIEVPRVGTSEPVRMRFLDDPLGENRTRPAARMAIVVQALFGVCTFVNPKNGKRTDKFRATTDRRGCLPAFQMELKDGELRSEVVRLQVKPDGWDSGTITMMVPIEMEAVEPEAIEEEPVAELETPAKPIKEPVAEKLASLLESPTARPFTPPTEPAHHSLPLGWMVAALVLLLGITATVFGELITRDSPLSNAVASNRSEAVTQPTEAAVPVAPEPPQIRILLAEKGDWHDVKSVCAQFDPRARCKEWSVTENAVDFRDCQQRFNENFGCSCPGTRIEDVFTYTVSGCRKTRVR